LRISYLSPRIFYTDELRKPMDSAADNPPPDPQSAAASDEFTAPATSDLNSSSPNAQSFQVTVQAITDQALQFLSTASNETIGACLVGLGATTYLVLGRVGLVLMGVVGGVVLHATWEGNLGHSGAAEVRAAEETRRREIGLDVIKRALTWQASKKNSQNEEDEMSSERIEFIANKNLDYSAYPPETATAMTELTDAIIRDYVKLVIFYNGKIISLANVFALDGGILPYFLEN
jgi:hypothetical protein